MKFRVVVGIPDTVIRAKLGVDRFSRFCMVNGRISGFPTDYGCRPYNTPARCRSVIVVVFRITAVLSLKSKHQTETSTDIVFVWMR